MATQQRKTTPKISVQIWRPVLNKLTAKMEAACLRRDAYLERVLATEIDHLDTEVAVPNTELARDYIAKRLDTLDRKLVSLAIEPALVARLNDICKRKNIVRDSFFNRLFLLLAAGPKTIDRLYRDLDEKWRQHVVEAYRFDGAFYRDLFDPLEPHTDPLWALRAAHEIGNEQTQTEDWTDPATGQVARVTRSITGELRLLPNVHTAIFAATTFKDIDISGLNVHLQDSWVPGSAAAEAERQQLDDLLSDL